MAVPIQSPPPPSYSEQAVRRMEAEHKLEAQEKFTGWAVIWTLFGFKMATVIMVIIIASHSMHARSEESWAYIISTTWYWFFIPLIALSGIISWKLRLRKARKNAQQLKRSEFSLVHASDLAPLTDEEKQRLSQLPKLAEHDR